MRIRVVDIETTGMEPPEAEVIELGHTDVELADGHFVYHGTRSMLYRPERPCPPEVMAVHHILPREYEHESVFSLVDQDHWGTGADVYAAHNAEYEMKFLLDRSRPWICTYKCALRIWPNAPSHGNQALMYWLGLHEHMREEERHPPHRAGPDSYVTSRILVAALCQPGVTVEQMIAWSAEPRLLPTCPIGKFRGKPWPQVDFGFLDWMLRQPDMEADLKWNARRELNRRRDALHRGDH